MSTTTTRAILAAAETRARLSGYNGFSFRDLAGDVGIKSASVHHHFPTKEALMSRLARDYTDRFRESLPAGATGRSRIAAYRTAFRTSFERDGRICLCGILGAEGGGLPDAVNAEARRFFALTIDDLAGSLDGIVTAPRSTAMGVIARLEGAHILARAMGDITAFDTATEGLEEAA